MKKAMFVLPLSLLISTFAMNGGRWMNGDYQESPEKANRYYFENASTLRQNAQCTDTLLAIAKKNKALAEKICASYKGKTGEGSTCALLCQSLDTLK